MNTLYSLSLPLKRTIVWNPSDDEFKKIHIQNIRCNLSIDEKNKLTELLSQSSLSHRYSIYSSEWINDHKELFIAKSDFIADPSYCISYIFPTIKNNQIDIRTFVNTDMLEDKYGNDAVSLYMNLQSDYQICEWLYSNFHSVPVFIPRLLLSQINDKKYLED